MNKLNYISAVILLTAASVAHAETATPLPGDQGLASVNKNLEKNPENKGLQNASEQLKRNQIKHAEQMEKREDKREEKMEKRQEKRDAKTEKHLEKRERHMESKTERTETRAERREAYGRPAKAERPGK